MFWFCWGLMKVKLDTASVEVSVACGLQKQRIPTGTSKMVSTELVICVLPLFYG